MPAGGANSSKSVGHENKIVKAKRIEKRTVDTTTFLLTTEGDVRLVAYGTLAVYVGSISLEQYKG